MYICKYKKKHSFQIFKLNKCIQASKKYSVIILKTIDIYIVAFEYPISNDRGKLTQICKFVL